MAVLAVLADPARARFDDHLGVCDGCRTYLGQMRRTVALTGSLRADDIDPLMLRRLAAAVRGWQVPLHLLSDGRPSNVSIRSHSAIQVSWVTSSATARSCTYRMSR